MEEALKRAYAYKEAGADAILMHSKLATSSEIESFVKEFNNILPVVIVPTKYYTTPTSVFRDWNISMVIWANHNMRACVQVMRDVSKDIFEKQNLEGVEGRVAKVNEIFELQDMKGLQDSDSKYLLKI